ncbi:BgTH12-04375 [Blumeria graminis f. sp. triticale]|uniref:BgTH12-04375 n=1 Tax=Blumeria graminis f. sp. triticale TaxID=1689686 RepID=A0A9W4GAP6_BLUGR|nr:BgTH12-04375 [Blumeria graminis f. sp. triticale]
MGFRRIQRGLVDHQGNRALRNRLLVACSGITELEFALYRPAETFEGVLNDMYGALDQKSLSNPSSQYHQQMNYPDHTNSNGIHMADRHYNTALDFGRQRVKNREERQKAFDRIKQRYPMKPDTEIRQFVIEVEGERPEDSLDIFLTDFESHLETGPDHDSDDEILQSGNLVEEIGGENAVAYLIDQAILHSFTAPRLNISDQPKNTNNSSKFRDI